MNFNNSINIQLVCNNVQFNYQNFFYRIPEPDENLSSIKGGWKHDARVVSSESYQPKGTFVFFFSVKFDVQTTHILDTGTFTVNSHRVRADIPSKRLTLSIDTLPGIFG